MSQELDVYLDGVHVGRLTQTSAGAVTFSYGAAYERSVNPTPLSLSMPLARPLHKNRVVSAWLEGLLPDNLAVRAEWGRRFQVSARNPFSLLRHVGRDAAGAVQVLPVDVDPPDAAHRTGELRPLAEAEVSAMLVALTVRDDGWEVGAGSGRWSLAGAQNKVALHRLDDGAWAVPNWTPPRRPTSSSRARVDTRFGICTSTSSCAFGRPALLGLPVVPCRARGLRRSAHPGLDPLRPAPRPWPGRPVAAAPPGGPAAGLGLRPRRRSTRPMAAQA